MEHKKSRLDLDSSSSSMQDPNPRNMSPFFNTSLGGGGSGVGGPHRGRYTRSSMGGIPTTSSSAMSSASSSRFSPYSVSRDRPTQRRSIPVITAQRDDRPLNRSSLGGGGSLFAGGLGSASSTAQKIMDSLASMSTPVLNAGRVRIDSIKPVKPIGMGSSALNCTGTFLSSSNKFSGPPRTLSPLMLPKTPSGFHPDPEKSMWSLKCLSIPPKMVDCGTSTDNEVIIRREFEDTKVIKMNVTPTPPPVIQRKSFSEITMPGKAQDSYRLADLIAKSRPVNGEYKFDKPWSLSDVDQYLASDQCKKETDRETISTSSSDTTTSDDVHEGDEYENNSKDLNTISNHKIVNGGVKSAPESKIKIDSFTFNPSPLKWSPPSKENNVSIRWECPTCMVFNDSTIVKCVCCGSSYPEETKPKPKPSSSLSPFGKISTGKDIISIKSVAVAAKWSCPTCMVDNENTAPACVCCSEPNPDPTKAKPSASSVDKIDSVKTPSSSTSGPMSVFKFGIPTAPTTSTTSLSSAPAFGSSFTAPAPTHAPTSSFQFGISKPLSTTVPSAAPPAYGSITAGSTSSSIPLFGFGATPTTTTAPIVTSTPFAASAFGSSSSGTSTTATPTFKFGTSTAQSSQSSTPTPPGFGSGSTLSAAPTPALGFGSGSTLPAAPTSTATPSFQFGTPTASITTSASAAPAFGSGGGGITTSVPKTPMFQFGNPMANSTPAFGSGSSVPGPSQVFQFQSKPSTASTNSAPSFQFGTPSAPISTPAPGPTAISSSNAFNFGAAPTGPPNVFAFGAQSAPGGPPPPLGNPTPLFQFQSNPSTNTGMDGRRKIKAARRFNR